MAICLATGQQARSATVGPVTFAESEFHLRQAIHGLRVETLNRKAIAPFTLRYSIGGTASDDARLRSGPGDTGFTSDPGIEGSAKGLLQVLFDEDISRVSFGFALSARLALARATTLHGFDATGTLVAESKAPAFPATGLFSGNVATLASGAGFRRLEIRFHGDAERFLVDNLAFDTIEAPLPIDEPDRVAERGNRPTLISDDQGWTWFAWEQPASEAVAGESRVWMRARSTTGEWQESVQILDDSMGIQLGPRLAKGNGRIVAVFQRQAGGSTSLLSRSFDPGSKKWSPVSSLVTGAVAAFQLTDGPQPNRHTLVWAQGGGVFARSLDSTGHPVGAVVPLVSGLGGTSPAFSVAATPAGLQLASVSSSALQFLSFDPSLRALPGRRSITTLGPPSRPVVVPLANIRTLVAWQEQTTAKTTRTRAQLIGPGGQLYGAEFDPTIGLAGNATLVAASSDAAGAVLLFSVINTADDPSQELWARFFSSGGRALGDRRLAVPASLLPAASQETPSADLLLSVNDLRVVFEAAGSASASAGGSLRDTSSIRWESTDRPRETGGCLANAEILCLDHGRFEVSVRWTTAQAEQGRGLTVPISRDTGGFWFFSPGNVELVVKVLDGTSINNHFWVFFASLTNVEFELSVVDLWTGKAREYYNEQGSFASSGDTEAFAQIETTLARSPRAPWGLSATAAAANDCPGDRICLFDGRFEVAVHWTIDSQHGGNGRPVDLPGDSGMFWFFDSQNIESVVKIVDGRSINGHIWFFYGGLTEVEHEVVVTDRLTGAVQRYLNPSGRFASFGDTTAFVDP